MWFDLLERLTIATGKKVVDLLVTTQKSDYLEFYPISIPTASGYFLIQFKLEVMCFKFNKIDTSKFGAIYSIVDEPRDWKSIYNQSYNET